MCDIRNIRGIIFEHGEDDLAIWEGFYLTEEETDAIMQIVGPYLSGKNWPELFNNEYKEEGRIFGIIYDIREDVEIKENIYLLEEEENFIWSILAEHDTEGCSVRGNRAEVFSDFGYNI